MFRIEEVVNPPKPDIGECLLNGGFPQEALPHLQRKVEVEIDNPAAWNNLGVAYKHLGIYDRSEESLRRSIAIADGHRPWHNLGFMLEDVGRFDEALECYLRANELCPNPNSQFGIAGCFLRRGEYALGLPVWEAARRGKTSFVEVPGLPMWTGQDVSGKRIIVTREGGFGDIFWLMRYLRLLKERGAEVTFHVFRSQRRLFDGHPWIDHVLDSGDAIEAGQYDFQSPLWSLVWRTGVCPLPMTEPYFWAKDKIPTADHPAVGLVWEAGEMLAIGRKVRSIQPEALAPFGRLPVNWVSLQMGQAPPAWCRDVRDRMKDWATTAEIIAGLDLVVTVDSAAAHLAGAMGVPTIVIVPVGVDWKFGLSGERSAWYDSWRVVRNTDPVSFQPAVDETNSIVEEWVQNEWMLPASRR